MTVVYEFIDDFEKWISPIFSKLVTPRNAPAASVD